MVLVETESLPICLGFALVSGILLTLSAASTAYPAYIDRKSKEEKVGPSENAGNTVSYDQSKSAILEYPRSPSVVDIKDCESACSSLWATSHRQSMSHSFEEATSHRQSMSHSFEDDVGSSRDVDVIIEADESDSRGSRSTSEKEEETKEKETQTQTEGIVSRKMWFLAYASNLIFAILGGTATLVGSWYGPVSIFSPIKQVSQILSGMVMFSFVLKTEEKPSKETSVGNFIIAVSTILLIFVGAEVKKEPYDIDELFDNDLSKIYGAGLLIVALVITFPFQFILGFTKAPCLTDRVNFVFLLITEVVHAVVATSASKVIPLLHGNWTWFSLDIVLMVITILTSAYSAFLRSTVILSQMTYMPLMLSMNVILNGITGLIIWNDQIQNIGGYVCTYLFFVMGVYLITDYEIRLNKQGEISLVRRAIEETTFLNERAAELLEERSTRQKIYQSTTMSQGSNNMAASFGGGGKKLDLIDEENESRDRIIENAKGSAESPSRFSVLLNWPKSGSLTS